MPDVSVSVVTGRHVSPNARSVCRARIVKTDTRIGALLSFPGYRAIGPPSNVVDGAELGHDGRRAFEGLGCRSAVMNSGSPIAPSLGQSAGRVVQSVDSLAAIEPLLPRANPDAGLRKVAATAVGHATGVAVVMGMVEVVLEEPLSTGVPAMRGPYVYRTRDRTSE